MTLSPQQRSQRAKALLEDEIFVEARESLKNEQLAIIANPATSDEGALAARRNLLSAQMFFDKLSAIAAEAAFAERNTRK